MGYMKLFFFFFFFFFNSLFGVEWVMPRRVLDLFSSWAIRWVVVKLSKFGSRLPLCVMWGLWRERNVRHFEDVEMPVLELRRNMLNTTNYLFFGPFCQFMPSRWMKSDSRAQHVTFLAQKS
jgi:hypothetical protein